MKKLIFITFLTSLTPVIASNKISKFEQDQINQAIQESLKTKAQDDARRAANQAQEQRQIDEAIRASRKTKEQEDARRAQREADERRRTQERRNEERREREQRELERRHAEEQRAQALKVQQALLARQRATREQQNNHEQTQITPAQPTQETRNQPAHNDVPVQNNQVQVAVVQPEHNNSEAERDSVVVTHPTNVNLYIEPTVTSNTKTTTHKERIKKAIARIIGGATIGCVSGAILGILKKQMIENQFGEGQSNFNARNYCMQWGTGIGALVGLVYASAQWM